MGAFDSFTLNTSLAFTDDFTTQPDDGYFAVAMGPEHALVVFMDWFTGEHFRWYLFKVSATSLSLVDSGSKLIQNSWPATGTPDSTRSLVAVSTTRAAFVYASGFGTADAWTVAFVRSGDTITVGAEQQLTTHGEQYSCVAAPAGTNRFVFLGAGDNPKRYHFCDISGSAVVTVAGSGTWVDPDAGRAASWLPYHYFHLTQVAPGYVMLFAQTTPDNYPLLYLFSYSGTTLSVLQASQLTSNPNTNEVIWDSQILRMSDTESIVLTGMEYFPNNTYTAAYRLWPVTRSGGSFTVGSPVTHADISGGQSSGGTEGQVRASALADAGGDAIGLVAAHSWNFNTYSMPALAGYDPSLAQTVLIGGNQSGDTYENGLIPDAHAFVALSATLGLYLWYRSNDGSFMATTLVGAAAPTTMGRLRFGQRDDMGGRIQGYQRRSQQRSPRLSTRNTYL